MDAIIVDIFLIICTGMFLLSMFIGILVIIGDVMNSNGGSLSDEITPPSSKK